MDLQKEFSKLWEANGHVCEMILQLQKKCNKLEAELKEKVNRNG